MSETTPPLSSTVASVFQAFLKRLEESQTLPPEAIASLSQTLSDQKFDPDSLREAIFTVDQSANDPN